MLRVVPSVVVAVLLLPIGAGLAGTALPAFGWLPAIGGDALSLQPWRDLVATPGFGRAVLLTVGTGFSATLLSFLLSVCVCAAASRRVQASLAPILATPHAALAIGFGFLIAPSGWLMRFVSPWATGFARPPDWAVVHDPWGVTLTLGLVLKETPFLILMTMGALTQVPAAHALRVSQALGYRRVTAWVIAVFPLVYPQIRMPIYAVLAFSLSVVDVALILGPSNPPTLAAIVLRDASDPAIARWFAASAGSLLLVGIVAAAIGVWRLGEIGAAALLRARTVSGRRGGAMEAAAAVACGAYGVAVAATFLSLAALLVWSVAGLWRFPDAWPERWTLAGWRGAALAGPAGTTLLAAVVATVVALGLVVACLEAGDRYGRVVGTRLVYAPLLVPQIGFLFGLQILLVRAGWDGSVAAVIGAHLLFVLPYVFLSLADPWPAMDARYARTAASLGTGPWRVLVSVKLPMMLRPLLIAAAVGVAVSVGLYLPTVFAGAGRVATLTTEAVTLSGSGDRRVLGAYAALQAAIPLACYALAIGVPRWMRRT